MRMMPTSTAASSFAIRAGCVFAGRLECKALPSRCYASLRASERANASRSTAAAVNPPAILETRPYKSQTRSGQTSTGDRQEVLRRARERETRLLDCPGARYRPSAHTGRGRELLECRNAGEYQVRTVAAETRSTLR
ncbi:hypothetical protein OH76DRAFT_443477 [Lentinus brumalis]|uniref:Uncharacterized protein n=1 Tax=Lentinus brumalis TaxID=2498619 RepID=A0A371CIM5_9APHY|nr:hypothetical protein OH76DRAFT_443477 [Polyporus brumalis]